MKNKTIWNKVKTICMDYSTVFLLLLIFLFFAITAPGFLSISNIASVLNQASVLLLVSVGMCFVVISGGTDLSVAAAYGLGGMIPVLCIQVGMNHILAFLIALAAGAVFGLINSFLILKVHISVWLTTLGTLFIGESIERIVTKGGMPIYLSNVTGPFRDIGCGNVLEIERATGGNITIKFSIIFALVITLIAHFVLKKTVFGRHLYAAGLQREASVLAGVSSWKCVTAAFVISGVCCAMGGIIGSSILSSYIPVNGRYYLLDAIGTVFIGSTMNKRGFANIPGMLAGVLFFGFMTNGLNLIGIQFYWQSVVRGGMILLILAIDAYQRNVLSLKIKNK